MNYKLEILNKLNTIDYKKYDQSIKGKGHYENLSILICNLLRIGFEVKEVETILEKMPINLTDKTLVRRWYKSLNRTTVSAKTPYNYFEKLLGIQFEGVTYKPVNTENLFNKMKIQLKKREHKIYSEKIKEFLSNYKVEHLSISQKRFNNISDFFKTMFKDDPNYLLGLAGNFNESQKISFNSATCLMNNKNNIEDYTHWCLNRPYFRQKNNGEGVCESDIINARYFLIEVDEGLTIEEQLKLADLLIGSNIPVKMITYSGSRSIHIICDLSIGILNRLNKKGMLSSTENMKDLRNHCNITFTEYTENFTRDQLVEYFGTNNVNEYYKNYIKEIYEVLYSLGIDVDFSCKNLNRWTRIPGGIRIKDGKKVEQKLLYFRDSEPSDDDVLEQFNKFAQTIKNNIYSKENLLFEL